jgi:hypothetical protein
VLLGGKRARGGAELYIEVGYATDEAASSSTRGILEEAKRL